MTINSQRLFAGVRIFVDDHCRIRQGEEVLVLSDTSVDPTVIEVFAEAAQSLGGRVSTMVMPYEEIRLATVEDRFPPAVKAAMCGTDVILLVALGIIAHYHPSVRPFVTAMLEHGARLVFAPGDAEIMASEFSRFPFELVKGIGDWVFQRWTRSGWWPGGGRARARGKRAWGSRYVRDPGGGPGADAHTAQSQRRCCFR